MVGDANGIESCTTFHQHAARQLQRRTVKTYREFIAKQERQVIVQILPGDFCFVCQSRDAQSTYRRMRETTLGSRGQKASLEDSGPIRWASGVCWEGTALVTQRNVSGLSEKGSRGCHSARECVTKGGKKGLARGKRGKDPRRRGKGREIPAEWAHRLGTARATTGWGWVSGSRGSVCSSPRGWGHLQAECLSVLRPYVVDQAEDGRRQ